MLGVNLIPKEKPTPRPIQKKQELWKLEIKEAIKSTSDLERVLKTKIAQTNYPIFITQRMARKVFRDGPNGPLWKQFVPHQDENLNSGLMDPIGDNTHAKPGKIIHRYKNRLLFFPTPICPINCRYCFRKNELAAPTELFEGQLKQAIDYLYKNPEVNEVILSGGDPLILSDSKLESILDAFSKVPNIKYFRFHTRTPIIIPSRITEGLTELLSKYKKSFHQLIIAVHTNHLDELDDDVTLALTKIKGTGVTLLSQTVLLKDVNDDTKSLKDLFTKLCDLGVKPYYLHHPDRAQGAMHFYLSLTEGRMLYHSLRNELSGWMLPQYVIDIPGGRGKVPAYNPEDFDFNGKLISKDGDIIQINPLH